MFIDNDVTYDSESPKNFIRTDQNCRYTVQKISYNPLFTSDVTSEIRCKGTLQDVGMCRFLEYNIAKTTDHKLQNELMGDDRVARKRSDIPFSETKIKQQKVATPEFGQQTWERYHQMQKRMYLEPSWDSSLT